MYTYLIKIFAAFFCLVFFVTLIWRRWMISLVRRNLTLFINHLWHARRFLQFAIFVFFFFIFVLLPELFGVLRNAFTLDLGWLTLSCGIWFQLLNSRNFVLLVSTCSSRMHHFNKFHVRRRYWFEFRTDLAFCRKDLLFLLFNLKVFLYLFLLLAFLVFV